MTPPNERSALRLVAGFLSGIGVLGVGLYLAPQIEQSSDVVQDGVGQSTLPLPQTQSGPQPIAPNLSSELASKAPDPDDAPAIVTVAPVPLGATLETDTTRVLTALASMPDGIFTEIAMPDAPVARPVPKQTINVTKRIVNFRDTPDSAPRNFELPPPPPPQADNVATAIETVLVGITPIQPQDIDQPQPPASIVQTAPAVLPAQKPAQPEAADLGVRSPEPVRVSVNSFGKKAGGEESTTSGLLAAVTGADRVLRQGFSTKVAPQDTQNAPGQASTTAPPPPPIATGPAFEAFAAEYQDTGEKALLAVILIDPGEGGMDRNFLKNLSFPVTFAVPATGDRAQFIDAEYREKGFEVLAMVPSDGPATLSRRARPKNLSDLLADYRQAVPGSIGLMDFPGGELHQDSRLLRALAEGLATSGHAMLTNKRRINNSDRIAQSAGIAYAKILRPIDADGSVPSIRRALERAALTASKAGGAVIVGYSEPQTIKTLYEWILSNSARSVDVAPVSAVIRRLGQS